MTPKRDYIADIQERRARLGEPGEFHRLFERLRKVLVELENAAALGDELMQHFPVAAVACAETYTREMVEVLVDSGPPFSDRIETFGGHRIEIETLKAIHGRRITLGGLLARLVHVSRLTDMQAAIGPLLAVDILDLVKERRPDDAGRLIQGIEMSFRLRHIYAHEFVATERIDRQLITDSVGAAAEFLTVLDAGILEVTSTQSAMNRNTAEHWTRLDEELRELAKELCGRFGERDSAALMEAQEAWQLALDRTARLMANLEAEGGSMWPMVYNRFAAAMTRHRLDELRTLQQFNW